MKDYCFQLPNGMLIGSNTELPDKFEKTNNEKMLLISKTIFDQTNYISPLSQTCPVR